MGQDMKPNLPPIPIVFSGILQEFIEPICMEEETGASLLRKSELGRLAWNYAIAMEYRLSIEADLRQAVADACSRFPAMQSVISLLVERKRTHFPGCPYFIIQVEKNDPVSGPTISVEYIPADQIEALLAKLNR